MVNMEEFTGDIEDMLHNPMFLPQSAMLLHNTDTILLTIAHLQLNTHMLHLMEVHGVVPVEFMDQECMNLDCVDYFIY